MINLKSFQRKTFFFFCSSFFLIACSVFEYLTYSSYNFKFMLAFAYVISN